MKKYASCNFFCIEKIFFTRQEKNKSKIYIYIYLYEDAAS